MAKDNIPNTAGLNIGPQVIELNGGTHYPTGFLQVVSNSNRQRLEDLYRFYNTFARSTHIHEKIIIKEIAKLIELDNVVRD